MNRTRFARWEWGTLHVETGAGPWGSLPKRPQIRGSLHMTAARPLIRHRTAPGKSQF